MIFRGDMGIEVEVVLDSISYEGIRLTTLRLRYWRPIHSELMTHRVFSRNARSSRAVPVTTLLKEDPYIPEFGANQRGMQAGDKLPDDQMNDARDVWKELIASTRASVKALHELGVHKQWANRPLEWFGWIDVLVTSTDWANWFALRNHSDAAPEIHELARVMDVAMSTSIPKELGFGEWHLPYILEEEYEGRNPAFLTDHSLLDKLKVLSTARCARLSYKPFDGNADYEKEQDRFEKLVVSSPVHASPAEHQATPDSLLDINLDKGQKVRVWANADKQGNFTGWVQHRKELAHEAVFDAHHTR